MLQPKHVKALFRRGMARRQLGKLAEAKADLEESLSLASDNGTIKAELDAVTLALKSKVWYFLVSQYFPLWQIERRVAIFACLY